MTSSPPSFIRESKVAASELRVEWKISLPATLAARIELLLLDPGKLKPEYGARSRLIVELLENWLDERGE